MRSHQTSAIEPDRAMSFADWVRSSSGGISRRTLLKGLSSAALLACCSPRAAFSEPAGKASTSRDSYKDAVDGLPLDELRDDMRDKLMKVIEKPSIYRRLPVEVIDCDPDLYLFLIRYPEVVVNMWQLMGITKVRLKRTAQYTLDATDGAGTVSDVELVYGTRDKHIIYGTGYYEGPLLRKRVNGQCVLFLRSGYKINSSGRTLVSSKLDVFVSLENVGADFLAKTLHPLVGKTADHNFSETTRFIAQVSQQAEVNHPGMQRLAKRLDNIADETREQFSAVTTTVNERAALRVAAYQKSSDDEESSSDSAAMP
jgi:hypothetical protein